MAVSLKILSVLGAKVRMLNKNTYEIDTTHLTGTNVPDDLSRQMRASYYFLGALLSRNNKLFQFYDLLVTSPLPAGPKDELLKETRCDDSVW